MSKKRKLRKKSRKPSRGRKKKSRKISKKRSRSRRMRFRKRSGKRRVKKCGGDDVKRRSERRGRYKIRKCGDKEKKGKKRSYRQKKRRRRSRFRMNGGGGEQKGDQADFWKEVENQDAWGLIMDELKGDEPSLDALRLRLERLKSGTSSWRDFFDKLRGDREATKNLINEIDQLSIGPEIRHLAKQATRTKYRGIGKEELLFLRLKLLEKKKEDTLEAFFTKLLLFEHPGLFVDYMNRLRIAVNVAKTFAERNREGDLTGTLEQSRRRIDPDTVSLKKLVEKNRRLHELEERERKRDEACSVCAVQ